MSRTRRSSSRSSRSSSRSSDSSRWSSYSSSDRSSRSSSDRETKKTTPRRSLTHRGPPSKSFSSPGGHRPEGGGGDRTRIVVTYREPASYDGASSRTVRWQRLEPKFEPRYNYYRCNTTQGGIRRDAAEYYLHRRKIVEARPVVDNRPPQIFPHIYCNMKRLNLSYDRQNAIERENRLLLGKLANSTTSRADYWNSKADSNSSPGRRYSRRQWENRQNEADYRKRSDRKLSSDFDSETSDRSSTRYKKQQQNTGSKERSRIISEAKTKYAY